MLVIAIFAYRLTGSAFLVTMLTMIRMLPMFLFGAFFGVAVDVVQGRMALLVSCIVLFLTSAAVALLAYGDHLAIWHVAVATFISGTVWSTDNPLRRLMIGRVVGSDHMANAMALDAGSNNASRIIAPVIGGIVLAQWGLAGCFALGAGLYVIAIAAALGIRHRNQVTSGEMSLMLKNVLEGFGFAIRDKAILGIFSITLIFNIFGWPILSLVPVIGQDNFGLEPRGIGILASMEGLGAIAGALAMFVFGRAEFYPKLYVYSVAIYLVALMAMVLLPGASLAGLALLTAGFCGAGFGVAQSTLVFRSVKPQLRGRMLGLLSVSVGSGPIGFVQIGLLADALGPQLAIVASAAEGLTAVLLTRQLWRNIEVQTERHALS